VSFEKARLFLHWDLHCREGMEELYMEKPGLLDNTGLENCCKAPLLVGDGKVMSRGSR